MKKTHAKATGAALALVVALASPAAAETVEADKLRQNLYGTCFTTEDEGWAVGDLGRIFYTINGGLSWDIQTAGTKRPFVSIACLDNKHLWAAGQAGQIAATVDGGKTWKTVNSGTDRQLLDIDFADANTGIVVGDYGRIARSQDGGNSWTVIPVPTDVKLPPDIAEVVEPGDIVLYALHFADPSHVWIVGEFGVIMASSDGGQTFVAQTSPVETTLFGVYFADAQRGWAVGMEATMLSTTDGGATWNKVQVESPAGFALALYDVAVDDDSKVGWAVGNNGFLLNSMDAGQTWKHVEVSYQLGSSWFRSLSLLPDGRGFAVGANGLVLSFDKDAYKALKKEF